MILLTIVESVLMQSWISYTQTVNVYSVGVIALSCKIAMHAGMKLIFFDTIVLNYNDNLATWFD